MATATRDRRALLKPLALVTALAVLALLAALLAGVVLGPSPAESAFPGQTARSRSTAAALAAVTSTR